jgi:Cu(I)/Ag(I) efflux system membrane fusion protein
MERWASAMRRINFAILVVVGISAASLGFGRFFAYSQTQTKLRRRIIYYVDPMHPAYKSDKPGIAPDCGMQLVPVFEDQAGNTALAPEVAQLPMGAVAIDSDAQRLSGIRVADVQKHGSARIAHVVGRVTPEDIRIYSVNSGVDGFIRETFNDSVGTLVKKDQKLATYYAPDFLSAASGFLAATERVPGAVGKDGARFSPEFPGIIAKEGVRSIQGYTNHLRHLGMSDEQIKRIAETRELPENIDVAAPVEGLILSRNVSPGAHFDHQMEFYRIADLSKVWVVAEVNEEDTQSLRPGGAAQVILRDAGRRLPARVTNSLPQSEAGSGTVKIRLEVENPSYLLRPDMLVDVDLPLQTPAAVTVPMGALVYAGERTHVYVERGEGIFEPREVETGRRIGEQVEILRGVQPGERIVVEATFLVDSESRMKMAVPATAPTASPDKPADNYDHMASAKSIRNPM